MKATLRRIRISLFTGCMAISFFMHAQPAKETYNVGIFLYEGVELLDFAGPGEVFGSSKGFKVYTVSVDGNPLLSQGFVTIDPQYAISDVPPTDILIFPGGNSTPSSNDPEVLAWIKKSSGSGSTVLSVCTGAEILAKAGVLENLNVTTFHNFIDGLQDMLPNSKVLKGTRYVDSGNIITTAGVSAGIDGALHLLARIKGRDVAKSTAAYMEYDKWKPNEGQIDYTNPYIHQLLTASAQPEKKVTAVLPTSPKNKLPYEGEFKNLAFALQDKGEYQQAAHVLEEGVKIYPHATSMYIQLAGLYKQSGKPKPLEVTDLVALLHTKKMDQVVKVIEDDHRQFPNWNLITEDAIIQEGYHLIKQNEVAIGLKILVLNTALYPNSAQTFESLGRAHRFVGNEKEAIANFKKSLQLNPDNNAIKQLLEEMGQKI